MRKVYHRYTSETEENVSQNSYFRLRILKFDALNLTNYMFVLLFQIEKSQSSYFFNEKL